MMETTVFHAPAVAGELTRFIEARLFTDHANDDAKNTVNRALQARLAGSRALPNFVVVDPRTGEKQPLTRGGTLDAGLFAEFLRAFPATPRHAAPR